MNQGVKQTVLITGGAGFIGSHAAERFIADGWHVVVVDDLSTGVASNLPEEIDFHEMDITDDAMGELIARERPRAVVHFAAQISVPVSMAHPMEDLSINLLGTSRIAGWCRDSGVGKFTFISSGGAIYGETPEPATEESIPRPMSYYGVHKLAAEYHVALSGVPYAILRPANVYGPRQRSDQEGGVVSIFVDSVRSGSPITIIGTGEQQRDFVHVSDVVDAVVRATNSDQNGVWNVGTGVKTSINQLADAAEKVAEKNVEKGSAPPRPGDVYVSCLDSAKLQRDLGWKPNVSLETGLRTLLCCPQ